MSTAAMNPGDHLAVSLRIPDQVSVCRSMPPSNGLTISYSDWNS